MPTEKHLAMDRDRQAAKPAQMFARSFGAPGPGTQLGYDDLTRSETWARVADLLLTLDHLPDARVTVTVMGTVIEYSLQPFEASPNAASVAAPTGETREPSIIDLRGW